MLEKVFTKFLIREELAEIGLFNKGKDLDEHLRKVEKRIKDLEIPEEGKANFLLKTFHENVLLEMNSINTNYENESYEWIIRKLSELYKEKSSKMRIYNELLNIKQKEGQSIKDFISEIRIKCSKFIPDMETQEREKIMVMTLIEGLSNRKQATILKQLEPNSVEEIYQLIKKERTENASEKEEWVMQVSSQTDEIRYLKEKLNQALERLNVLEKKVSYSSMPRKSENLRRSKEDTYRRFSNDNFRKSTVKCYECNIEGHFRRDCPNLKKQIRNVETESLISISTAKILNEGETFDQESNMGSDTNDAYAITYSNPHGKHQQKRSRNFWNKNYPRDVECWNNYVHGHGNKPRSKLQRERSYSKSYAPTLISQSKKERAANKPVVEATLEGNFKKNIFLDSGCECNIIDLSYWRELAKSSDNIKMIPHEGTLSCANGTPLNVVGYTLLKLNIGKKEMQLKFAIVESIFPNVLIGIRAMKKEGISIVPSWDCIRIGKVSVPFISKTKPETVINTKN